MTRERPDTDEVLDPLPPVVSRGYTSGDHAMPGSLRIEDEFGSPHGMRNEL
jgi:hypothetical protein